jgi:cystathionine beta-lyase/cystathionine gamma-synthase
VLLNLLPRLGVSTTPVDQTDPAAFEKALTPRTKVMVLESPSNPLLQVTDLMSRHNANGQALAEALKDHPAVARVHYPGLASLGGVESLAVHPAAMWRGMLSEEQIAASGVARGLVRLAAGTEDTADLVADVLAAADAVASPGSE